MSVADPQYPLNQNVVRLLHDKLYERRKTAALEVERIVRSLVTSNQKDDVHKALNILTTDFALSNNPNSRKGGLIGLAACAIALGNMDIKPFLGELLKPVVVCSMDQDSRIRYFACESLYNIVKVARTDAIQYFNQLFDALSKITADPDVNVRKGSDLLDRLLKDIILESTNFDISSLVPLLCNLIYSNNSFTRIFLVQWISCLDNIPDIDMILYLPKLLDGLFLILGDKSLEIQKMCETTMDELRSNIKRNPNSADINAMSNIIITHSQSKNDFIKAKALVWMNEFINLAGPVVVKYASGIIEAILPTLAYEDLSANNVRESAKISNQSLMKLIDATYDKQDEEESVLPINEMIGVLTRHLKHQSIPTRIAVIRWFTHLLVKTPYLGKYYEKMLRMMFSYIEDVFPHVMKTLSDPSDDVVQLALECLAEIVSSPAGKSHREASSPSYLVRNEHFNKFLQDLVIMFNENPQLLENRSIFIIRQLSVLLNAEDVFSGLAEFLLNNDDYQFTTSLVQTLNTIMMTTAEFYELRNHLKNSTSKESSDLFCCLYKTWCHSPVATVSLCLLTQNYLHCYRLLMKFSDFDITVDFLTEVDKLIQLLESPIFTSLRLQLLDTENNEHLVKCLYAILMLLPQTASFHVLQRRLNCIPPNNAHLRLSNEELKQTATSGNKHSDLDFDDLLGHFVSLQKKHAEFQKTKRKMINRP